MKLFRIAALLLAISAGRADAVPKAGDIQPDRIAVGTVFTGATVEASFMIFEPGNNADIGLKVTAPKFVKVLNKTTDARQFGAGNNFVCGSVEIAIDTSGAGQWSGEVSVTLGQTTATLPVSATVKPRRTGALRLLIAEAPFVCYSTSDGEAFKPWTDLVRDARVDVSYLLVSKGMPVLRDLDLRKFDIVFLAGAGLVSLTPADIQKARVFAEKGGHLVVAANHFMIGTVDQANALLAGHGLQMRDQEAPFGQNAVMLDKDDLNPAVARAGVKSVSFFRASPVAVTDANAGRVLVKAVGVGQAEDGFVASTRAGKGKMTVIGQSLWWDWIGNKRAAGTDNVQLLRWLLLRPKQLGL